ncbi:hypothetical protein DFJ58DRAFT_734147 [Suillus subalutaceus]|uniref:uncharacterized protein n=1 Tax=Suillus subalutaceus TaxID=48586 RepID=UPI001B8658C1|nr:uncharacterized protein DFJ58DRAFT_734147 [Suillus subalutaceus]KAG1837858.1 hypothetical protein DFJ58DRAFT_734147 [Suillus subalutaceus]
MEPSADWHAVITHYTICVHIASLAMGWHTISANMLFNLSSIGVHAICDISWPNILSLFLPHFHADILSTILDHGFGACVIARISEELPPFSQTQNQPSRKLAARQRHWPAVPQNVILECLNHATLCEDIEQYSIVLFTIGAPALLHALQPAKAFFTRAHAPPQLTLGGLPMLHRCKLSYREQANGLW